MSLRISLGIGPSRWPTPKFFQDIDIEVADHHDATSARMLSLPRLNSPDSM